MKPFVTSRRVEFSDTDSGGVVHFSRYMVYMETAEHQFLRSRGLEVDARIDGRRISWPRVEARCRYARPLRFGDQVEIEVAVRRRGEKSMTYGFTFRRDGQVVAEGETSAVCCAVEEGGRFQAIPIPEEMIRRLDGAGEET